MSDKRRCWGFLVYPDKDYDRAAIAQAVRATGAQAILSPTHDRDAWTAKDEAKDVSHKAGQLKKAHIHGMWIFSGGARASQALELCRQAFGSHCPPHVEPIYSRSAYVRYMCHLDQPDKWPYDPADIEAFGGASVCLDAETSASGELADLLGWIDAHDVREYASLVDWARVERPDLLSLIARRAVFFGHYFASRRAVAHGGEVA